MYFKNLAKYTELETFGNGVLAIILLHETNSFFGSIYELKSINCVNLFLIKCQSAGYCKANAAYKFKKSYQK